MTVLHELRGPMITAAFVLMGCICSAGQAGRGLVINGKVVTTDLKTINGKTYAPIADIARAFNMTLVNKAGSIEMIAAGGANEVAGLHGKLGEQLFTGKWRFTAVSIDQTDNYKSKNEDSQDSYTPRNNQETLFVVNCRIKNAQKEPVEMVFSHRICGNTALTDGHEHSYAPIGYDAHNETGPYGGPKMLPGSAAEFSVIFSAPTGTVPKDLVFTIISGKDLHDPKPGIDLRISLMP